MVRAVVHGPPDGGGMVLGHSRSRHDRLPAPTPRAVRAEQQAPGVGPRVALAEPPTVLKRVVDRGTDMLVGMLVHPFFHSGHYRRLFPRPAFIVPRLDAISTRPGIEQNDLVEPVDSPAISKDLQKLPKTGNARLLVEHHR